MSPRISLIVAIGDNHVIGKRNELLWHIPDDLKRFKQLTLGHPVVMGRKTFDSIIAFLGKPLPGRQNIVITRDTSWSYEGVTVAHSLEEAVEAAEETDEIFIIGGEQIYRQALPIADRLYLTRIDDAKEGDAFFPPYEDDFKTVLNSETREHNGLTYHWIDLERSSMKGA